MPRYVSTVDSGNLAGALITLRQACLEMYTQPCLRKAPWQGLGDILGLLERTVSSLLKRAEVEAPGCIDAIREVRSAIRQRDRSNLGHVALIEQLRDDTVRRLDSVLLDTVRQAYGLDLADLEEIETWSNALNEHLESMHLEAETCFPWLNLLLALPDTAASLQPSALESAWQALLDIAQSPMQLADTSDITARMRVALRAWQEQWAEDHPPQVEAWTQAFNAALDKGDAACVSVRKGLHEAVGACTRELEGMDFSLLYDAGRTLFHIGYNVSDSRLDPHHYDLIASEARLASFVAIARGVAPTAHWSQMSRRKCHDQPCAGTARWCCCRGREPCSSI